MTRLLMLALALSILAPACAADDGDELADEVDDPGTGDVKADALIRPEGYFYLNTGKTAPGSLEGFSLDSSDHTFTYVLEAGASRASTRFFVRGDYRFTKSGSRRYIKLTPDQDLSAGPTDLAIRYQYTFTNGKLGLHLVGKAGGFTMLRQKHVKPSDAWFHKLESRYASLADNNDGLPYASLTEVPWTQLPAQSLGLYDYYYSYWNDYLPVIYTVTIDNKKTFWLTEDNDGGGYLHVLDKNGALLATGSYSESEDFSWWPDDEL
jgi:hypothetical protein